MFLPRATSWQVVEKDLLLGLSFSAETLSSVNKLFMTCSCPKHPTATGVTLETPDLSHHTFILSSPPTHPSIHLLIIHPSICHPFIHLPTHIFTSVYKSTYPSIHPPNKLFRFHFEHSSQGRHLTMRLSHLFCFLPFSRTHSSRNWYFSSQLE